MQPATIEEAERIARTALTYANITPPVATVAEITPEASALERMTGTLTTLVEALSFQPRDQPRDPPWDEPREQQRHQDRYQPRPGNRGQYNPRQGYGGRGRGTTSQGVSSNTYNSNITCHRCGRAGHYARRCMTETKDIPQNQEN